MSILERLATTKKLWAVLLPDCPVPEDRQLGRWVSQFSEDEIEYAMGRTGHKHRQGSFSSAEQTCRYLTGVLINERRESHAPNTR